MRSAIIGLLLILAGAAAGSSAGADDGLAGYRKAEPPVSVPKLENPGFESGTEGWALADGYRFDRGGGRNGTGSLYLTRSDAGIYTLCSQSIRLDPGARYRFGGWIRTEGVRGDEAGAGICLEYHGEKGWLGGAYPDGVKGTKDWTRVEGMLMVPANAVNCTITPYLRQGMTGTAWFDDMYVTPEAASWSAYLITPRQETISTAGGRLAFGSFIAGEFLPPPGRISGADLSCRLEAVGSSGRVLQEATAPVKDGRIEAELGAVPEGRLVLRLKLLETKRKLILAEQSVPVNVVPPVTAVPANSCVIDEAGRATVGGKPFLPVGLYLSGMTKEDIGRLAASPFNCAMPYDSTGLKLDPSVPGSVETIRGVLDECQAKGIKVIFSIKDIFAGTQWETLSFEGAKGEDAVVEKMVTAFRGHPALLAWYVNDELPTTMLDRLVARRRLVNRLDPWHPTWAVLYQYEELPAYGPTCDVLGVDPYPIRDARSRDMGLVSQAMEAARKAVGTERGMALWMVPQAFSWGSYDAPDRKTMLARNRYPTEGELRAMVLLAALKGARGFVFYSYFDLFRPQTKPDFERRWAEICRVGKVLRGLEPWLLSAGPPRPVAIEQGKGKVEAASFTDSSGRRCVIVAGIGPGESSAVLVLEGQVKYRSRFGLAESLGKGRYRFRGRDICADILEEIR